MQQQGQARQAYQLPDTQLALQVTSPWPAQTPWLATARQCSAALLAHPPWHALRAGAKIVTDKRKHTWYSARRKLYAVGDEEGADASCHWCSLHGDAAPGLLSGLHDGKACSS
jgi:hypothetical protein